MEVAPTLLRLLAPFSPRIKTWLQAVSNWRNSASLKEVSGNTCNIWFHCASLGEYEQGKPVMEALKRAFPSISLVVTFFSPSGYNARKNSPLASYVGYLPVDTVENAKEFISLIRPKLVFFVKSEIWPNYIITLRNQHIPTFLLSARFHEEQTIFKKRGNFFLEQLKRFDVIFTQNSASHKLLRQYKIDSVVSGDTRYDQVAELLLNKESIPYIDLFKSGKKLLVAGSCWPEDVAVLKSFIENDAAKIILAPHDISGRMIESLQQIISVPFVRYSQISHGTDLKKSRVLVIDNIGMLSRLYAYCDVAFVGGAFKQGLHNILEPAVYGAPVLFGPQTEGFPEASDMMRAGGAWSVKNQQEATDLLKDLFSNDDYRTTAGELNRKFMQAGKGATEKVMVTVKTIVANQTCFTS